MYDEQREIDKVVEDIHKYKLDNLDSKKIKKIKYDQLKKIIEDKNELIYFYKLLNNYRYVDEVDEIRIGSYIRFFNLKKAEITNTLELMRGGFVCDLRVSNNDIIVACRNGNRFFNIKMNECFIFQKNTKQEEMLIQIIDNLK
jgi:hypothetical protein